jgi:hypothetical protein
MTIQEFAEVYRLKVARDECNDPIIRGRRGHLYVDAGQVCLMILDGRPIKSSRLAELGGRMWQGSICPNPRVQDCFVKGISPDKVALALRFVGAKRRKVATDAQRAALAKGRLQCPLFQFRPLDNGHSQPTGANDLDRVGRLYPAPEIEPP